MATLPARRLRGLRAPLVPLLLLTVASCAGSMKPEVGAPASAAAPGPMGAAGAVPAMEAPPGFGVEAPKDAAADKPAMAPAAPMADGKKAERAYDDEEMAGKPPPQPMWAPVREFPVPSHPASYSGPRVDFRETIYWNPRVVTDAKGEATVSFTLSDAVTSFRATVEGVAPASGSGVAAHGESLVASRLPVSLSVKLPLEVSSGDEIELPVTVTNSTWTERDARLVAAFGKAFGTGDAKPQFLHLAAKASAATTHRLKVTAVEAEGPDATVSFSVESNGLKDAISRVVRVVPPGFPQQASYAGTLTGNAKAERHEFDLPETLPGTLQVSLAVYPSPAADLLTGTTSILQEPSGCFEQASSANYPNVMVLGYLKEHDVQDPQVTSRASTLLDHGYKKLVGYETKQQGYDWFGEAPGHEALTAYGLLEFHDMAKVYPDLDKSMVARTAKWLKDKRDGKGGYTRQSKSADSFGQASDEVTNAYITYALIEAGERDLGPELAYVGKLAAGSKDPYVLALATGALLAASEKGDGTGEEKGQTASEAVSRLAKMQAADGHFGGADHSITRSGGIALEIETTALAALAFMRADATYEANTTKALSWIGKQRGASGGFASTQSTVLALKALTKGAERSKVVPEGTVTVTVNGGKPHELKLDGAKGQEAITLAGLGAELHAGHNEVVLSASAQKLRLPYGLSLKWRSRAPLSNKKTAVSLSVSAPKQAKVGEGVKVHATIVNSTSKPLPMVLARVGIPGGLTFQTWQLDALKQKKVIDFYETREREVVLYLRGMAPGLQKAVDLELLAEVPGTYTAPASQAYLYYTDELRTFVEPLKITVSK